MANGKSFPCSIKIRIDSDIRKTVELCRQAEQAGADWITVHGRLKKQKNEGLPNLEAIRIVKESVSIPVFGNGGVTTLEQVKSMRDITNVDGVMVAQGLLENPGLFKGNLITPLKAIEDFVKLSVGYGSSVGIVMRHVSWMLDKRWSKEEKKRFHVCNSMAAVIDYLEDLYDMSFSSAGLD